LHMIDADVGDAGIRYRASEDAQAFVETLRTEYSADLKRRAVWLAQFINRMSDTSLSQLISTRIDRWAVEFQGEAGRPSSQ
jgi:hypothetical protein